VQCRARAACVRLEQERSAQVQNAGGQVPPGVVVAPPGVAVVPPNVFPVPPQ
jgi:hypothetical protein